MAFDPNLPAANSPIVSAELRSQFNGLSDRIDECALNPVGLEQLSLEISDPPTKAEVEAIRDKINDMINRILR